MKKIILTEGEHDTQFLEQLINDYHPRYKIDRLDIDSQPSDTRIPRETSKIQQFKGRWNSDDILLKSEGGKPNLLEAVPVLLRRYYREPVDIDILIDLDNDSISDFKSKINDTFAGTSAGNPVSIQSKSGCQQRGNAVSQKFGLISDRRELDDFHIIGLDPDLEQIANIRKGDTKEEIEERIDEVVDASRMCSLVTESIFDTR